jgi:DNA polymerase-3 subunit beta
MAKQKNEPAADVRMELACNRQGLLSACRLVSVAVSGRDVKPALRNIKAVAESQRLTLIGTDLELGIRLDLKNVRVGQPGAALLPAGRLIAILSETADEELALQGSDSEVVVRSSTGVFDMPGEDLAGFPDVPDFDAKAYHEITASVLKELIRRTLFAAAPEGNAHFLATTGVLWELEGDSVTLVATDGRRLAIATGQAKAHGGHSTAERKGRKGEPDLAVIPGKAMTLLARLLSDPDQVVRVAIRPNDVLVKTEHAVLYTRLLDGRFPSYRQVIPTKATFHVPLTAAPMMNGIRQAAVLNDEDSQGVHFQFTKRKLTLSGQGATSGKSKIELPINYDGKATDIRFNPDYVNDMLRVLEPDAALSLDMSGNEKPAVFKHGDAYTYVAVPLVPTKP